jgi:hypothetical protein
VAIVVGIGSLAGTLGTPDSGPMSIVATGVAAMAFQPVRGASSVLLTGWCTQASHPYEVLSEFSGRMGETYGTVDLLRRMAQTLAARNAGRAPACG